MLVSPSAADWSIFTAQCAESDDTDTVATETSNPLAGEIYHYLVRVENGCGGHLGHDSGETPRSGRSCP